MLSNPKWTANQLGPVSLKSLIAWLETKPKDQEYDYCNMHVCVLGQYMQAQGKQGDDCKVDLGFNDDPDQQTWQRRLKQIAQPHPQTFGAALERARAAVTSTKWTD